jgi:DNA end-binding protein Ku
MARPIWSGAISFGLVNVPVDVYPADESHALSFSMLDRRDFAPVGYKRYNKKSGVEVPWESIVKGYEYDKGQYVVLTDEDFRRANVKASQTIEIETFVPSAAIPAPYFETPYYLVPRDRGQKAYALLRDTLAGENKLGIGQVVIRTKQHLVALIPEGQALVLNILRYPDELRNSEGLDLPPKTAKAAGVNAREMELARKLIDDMSGRWKPEQFKDTYHRDLMKRIEEKVKRGETKELTAPEKEAGERKSAEVIDLMELLKKSIAKSGRKSAMASPQGRAAAEKKVPSKSRTSARPEREKSVARRKRA